MGPASQTGVHHYADAFDGHAGLGEIGREHDTPKRPRSQDPILFRGGETSM